MASPRIYSEASSELARDCLGWRRFRSLLDMGCWCFSSFLVVFFMTCRSACAELASKQTPGLETYYKNSYEMNSDEGNATGLHEFLIQYCIYHYSCGDF